MADRKITDLTALTTPASADVLPIVDVSEAAAADKNKKITVGELFKGVPDGTAAAPAIAFESDDGNGIFLSTTDTVGIATNGSSRMTVSTTAVTSTLPVIVPDGTAAAPSVAFTGSGTDTGFYSDAANTLAATTGGTNALYIDSSQRVGIGTTTAETALHLRASSPRFRLEDSDGGYAHIEADGGNLNLFADNGASQANSFIGFGVDGLEKARIDSSGRLGLGTSTPLSGAQLTVAGAALAVTGQNTAHSANSIRIGEEGSGLAQIRCYGPDTSTRGSLKFTMSASDGTSNADVVIDSSGRVGIGTTTVNDKVVIAHADDEGLTFKATGTDGTTATQITYEDTNGGTGGILQFDHGSNSFSFETAGSERARIDSSGRLLVGTSTARSNFFNGSVSAALQVEGTGNDTSSLSIVRNSNDTGRAIFTLAKTRGGSVGSTTVVQNNDVIGSVEFQGSDGTEFVQAAAIECQVDGTPGANDMPGRLVFSTTADGASSPTERMRIDNLGKVTVWGTAENLVIDRSGNGNRYITFGKSTADGSGYTYQIFYHGASNVGSISYNGSGTSFNTSSDYRIKENVIPLENAANRLQQLKPSRFNFIHLPSQTVDGFIAHEVQDVVPEAIHGEKDAVDADGNPVYQGIDQSKLVPLLTAALQEALAKIETLEQRLNDAGIA